MRKNNALILTSFESFEPEKTDALNTLRLWCLQPNTETVLQKLKYYRVAIIQRTKQWIEDLYTCTINFPAQISVLHVDHVCETFLGFYVQNAS